MRIAVDVMGGDHAPDAILTGSLNAVDLLGAGDRLVLVGAEQIIREEIAERGLEPDDRLEVIATTEVIAMAESPITAIRGKPDSSLKRLAELGGRRHSGDLHCDAIISAGNTGACVAAAQTEMRRLPGVTRPGIAVPLPAFHGPIVLCDVGANPEPKPHHLHQYAHMAEIYARLVVGVESPRIALLSIGGEEGKGNALVRDSHKLIKDDQRLNYVGYVEGRGVFNDVCDVVITEGFTGNVVLKLAEGMAAGLFMMISHEVLAIDPELALKFEPVVKSIYAKHDYHEFGGAPLLGANGICMICHGSSEARTIEAAVKAALQYVNLGVNRAIIEALSQDNLVEQGAS